MQVRAFNRGTGMNKRPGRSFETEQLPASQPADEFVSLAGL